MPGLAFRAGMLVSGARYFRPLERHADRPDAAQQDVLRHILGANRDSRFGREHGFADTADAHTFRSRVAVQDYESLRPYIEDQRRTGAAALTTESPLFYAQTSGSTGRPKYIPITPSALALHRSEQALFTYLQFRACPDAFSGKALGIMGAAEEGRLDTGHAVGSVSGYLYQSLPRAMRARFVVPPELSAIADHELKYLAILQLALSQPHITYLGTPNPSTLVRLIDVLNDRRDDLLQCLATGRPEGLGALDPAMRQLIAGRLRADPRRAEQLRGVATLTYANTWPDIRLVTTWTGGSCGIALGALRSMLPAAARVMELGYQSTECRGTIALDAETSGGVPPLHHHFFEFVEQDAWDMRTARFLSLAELQPATRYYVLITTSAGLYRYFMNDLVEVTGRFRRTPLLRFVQKGKGVTSLTGEKLYEAQVIEAVQAAAEGQGVTASFFVLVADEQRSAYHLFAEMQDSESPDVHGLAASVDARLGELNIEYHGKRASGRLGALTAARVRRGTGDAYKTACVQAGQREGQFKPAVLQYRKDLLLQMEPYVVS